MQSAWIVSLLVRQAWSRDCSRIAIRPQLGDDTAAGPDLDPRHEVRGVGGSSMTQSQYQYSDNGGVGWDYETNYYHIYAAAGPLDGNMDPIIIEMPQTPKNDEDVQAIVALLNRIATRLDSPV